MSDPRDDQPTRSAGDPPLDRSNSDQAGWIKKFDDELARCAQEAR